MRACALPISQSFPSDFTEAIRQAQDATAAALADGHTLLEIDFPSAGLGSVSGDAEGAVSNFLLSDQREAVQLMH